MPPLSLTGTHDADAISTRPSTAARADSQAGRPQLLAQPRRARRDARVPASTCIASSRAGLGVARPGRPPQFLKLMGASLALAGVTRVHARSREETHRPLRPPARGIIPGKPLFFATAMTLGGVGTGLLVESHKGRPTKIEGNPDHPASLGATDLFAQARDPDLYDPDRSQTITHLGEIRPWSAFARGDAQRARRRSRRRRAQAADPHRDRRRRRRSAARSGGLAQRSRRQVASVGAGRPRQRARGRALAFGVRRAAATDFDKADVDRLARRRLPRLRPPATCATRASSPRAAASTRERRR